MDTEDKDCLPGRAQGAALCRRRGRLLLLLLAGATQQPQLGHSPRHALRRPQREEDRQPPPHGGQAGQRLPRPPQETGEHGQAAHHGTGLQGLGGERRV